MSKKFNHFMENLELLCQAHDVEIDIDRIRVWDRREDALTSVMADVVHDFTVEGGDEGAC